MTRSLGFVVAETGPCSHCYCDPADHTIDGLCVMGTLDTGANVPQSSYEGKKQHAFIDLEDPMPELGPKLVTS